ncbi:MAG: sorting protein, partial [Verrucomicrobiota bacterium]|nr:sorting protein [Verrucomicrobiota bacterium]
GDLNLSTASSYVRFINGASFTGANATFANNAHLRWQQTGTLAGKTITMGSGAYIYLEGANRSLTLDATTTVTGDVSIYSDGSAGTTITNQGVLTHNINTTGYLYAESLSNQGTLNVSTGTLYFGYYGDDTTTNAASGVINLTGGNLYVNSPMTNAGQLKLMAGVLYTNNNLTNAIGGFIGGAGTINGDLALAGGTLAPGNSIGTLTFQAGSDFVVSGASTFEVELDATNADKIVFQNPGAVNLGSGLLQLSLNLLSAPTPNASYTLMEITSGGSGISGYLAGMPVSGTGITAYFAGNPYDFHVTYLTNQLLIHAVPEPGTYALMGAGLAALALLRRRRKVS